MNSEHLHKDKRLLVCRSLSETFKEVKKARCEEVEYLDVKKIWEDAPVSEVAPASVPTPPEADGLVGRVEALEAEVARLRAELDAFRAQFE